MSRPVRFALGFVLSILAGHALLSLPFVERVFVDPWVRANVAVATTVVGAHAGEREMTGQGVRLEIGRGCDGLGALLVVASASLASPARVSRRLLGLLGAAVVVFAANAVRLATLYLVARSWPARLELFHVDVWQPVMMLVALATFVLWGYHFVPRASD